jgi:hypothetical protein
MPDIERLTELQVARFAEIVNDAFYEDSEEMEALIESGDVEWLLSELD